MATNYFKEGNPGSPGRPKLDPEVVAVRNLTTAEYIKRVNKYLLMEVDELKYQAKQPGTIVLDQMIISVVMHAIKFGDYKRIESLLSRAIGPVQANIFLAQMQVPQPQPEGVTIDVENLSDEALRELNYASRTPNK